MATEVGAIRARMELDARGFNQELQKAKQNISESANEAKRVNGQVRQVTRALLDMGLSGREVRKVQQELRDLRPDVVEKQLKNVEIQLRRLGASDDQIAKITSKMREAQRETEKFSNRISAVSSSLTALGAGAGLAGIARVVTTFANEAQQLSMSYQGLTSVSKSMNADTEKSIGLVDELSDKWNMNKGIVADTVKTYLTAGLTLEQTREIMTATADAAAFNREKHLEWDEAVRQVAQGIKMGNSELTDAAGITTNLSVMYERYAKSIGTTAAKLTEAQKIQAAYNGIISESAMFAGNADQALEGFAGTQTDFRQTIETARQEIGEAYIPALENMMKVVSPLIRDFTRWAEENPKVVAGMTAAVAAVLALVTAVTALSAAFLVLNTAIGPVGWAILGIGALVTGTIAYKAAADAASESVWQFARSQDELNKKLAESPLSRSADDVKRLQSDTKTLNELIEERNRLEKEYATIQKQIQDARSGGDNSILHKLNQEASPLVKRLNEIDKALTNLGANTPEDAARILADMNNELEASIPALIELERENTKVARSQYEHIDRVEKLRKRYDDLSKSQKLDAAQKAELTNVVKSLTQEYPKVDSVLDENGKWIIKNTSYIDDLIRAEKESANAASEKSKERLETWRKETEQKLKFAQNQVKALAAIEGVDLSESALGRLLPDGWAEKAEGFIDGKLGDQRLKAQQRANDLQMLINNIDSELQKITSGSLSKFNENPSGTPDDDKKGKTVAELQQEQYQAALKMNEYKKALNQMNEEQELKSLESLLAKYKKNADIRMDLEVKIYKLKEQMSLAANEKSDKAEAAAFKASSEWIDKQVDLMTLAGKTEQEIIQMKIEAWTRVRSRYAKDSDYYMTADNQLTKAKIENMKLVEKSEEEAAKEREKSAKESINKALDAIDKQKKAELDALDERRRAIEKFYDDQEKAIDNAERSRERSAIVAEMELYRNATSEKGQKTFLEAQERLRQHDLEDQKRNLQDQRDQQLETLDRQKRDVETWYDDLRSILDGYSGDAIGIYKLIEDERFKAFTTTNEKIKAELSTLQSAYATTMIGAGGQPNTPSNPGASVIAQMQANSAAWKSASASRRKELEAENQRLGDSIGATYNSGSGRWYKDGVPLYHTGGIAGVGNFRSGDRLLPDEVAAVLRVGEPVLTPEQVKSLVGTVAGGGKTSIVIEKFMEVNDPVFEDGIDLETFGRETGNEAAEILRKKLTGGGGIG